MAYMFTKIFKVHALFLLLLGVIYSYSVRLEANTNTYPSFQEVLDTIKKNLPSSSSQDWDKLAIEGLLNRLDGKVMLLSNQDISSKTQSYVSFPRLYDSSFAHFRLLTIEKGISQEMESIWAQLSKTNTVKGIILDLRFAKGSEFPEIQKIANLFINKEIALFKIGEQNWKTEPKTNPIACPVIILVNRETRAAAEALSGVMQEAKLALIIGSQTAGQALGYTEYPISQGFILKIAREPIQLGNNTVLSRNGIKPDIGVPASIEMEWQAYTNTYSKDLGALTSGSLATNTNANRSRINEAQLVRMQKEGKSLQDVQSTNTSVQTAESSEIFISDQVLLRALDVLKALNAMQSKSK